MKEDLDDACNNKNMPNDFYMDMLFRSTESRRMGHPLDACIPANLVEQNGETCYFADDERNVELMRM